MALALPQRKVQLHLLPPDHQQAPKTTILTHTSPCHSLLKKKNTFSGILADSTKLLEKTAEQESKVASLEEENTSLTSKFSKIASEVEKFADKLISHGCLTQEKKAEFIESLKDDPSGVVRVMDKLASLSSTTQIGTGDEQKEAEGIDPIAKFALG